ncbi:MAG: DUF2330 domain-containing protein [bacterium]
MFKKQFIILSILTLFLPILTLADGMVIPPRDRYVYETGQKAVIFYEKGVETLVLSIAFKGDAEDFAWIIPTPQKPEVNKSSDELFSSLEKLTAPQIDYNRPQPLFLGATGGPEEKSVQIIETKKIDYYDITVLTAGDKEALVKWLNEHEYQFPENSSYILDSYIKDKWYFTAVKIDASSISSGVEAQLREGHAIPLQLVFKTDKPVYPLKISSIMSDVSPKNTPTYSEGKAGKAVKLSKDEYLTYYHSGEVDLSRGTVSFWFKPDEKFTKGQGDIFYFSDRTNLPPNVIDSTPYNNYLRIYKAPNNLQINLQLALHYAGWEVNPSIFKVDEYNHLVFVWRADDIPLLYINGQEVSLETNKKVPSIVEMKVKNLAYNIGGSSDYINARYDRTFNLYIDEVQTYQKTLSIEEIKNIYNQGKANLDNDTIFLAHFDDNLTIGGQGGISGQFIFINNKPRSYYPKPTNIGIMLYVFTPDKKQQVADFATDYAGWVKRDQIKNLASLDNGQPWLSPTGSKYYLTRLSQNMNYSEMTYDLYLKDAPDNETFNYIETSEKGMVWFWLVISFAILLTLILLVVLIIHYRR